MNNTNDIDILDILDSFTYLKNKTQYLQTIPLLLCKLESPQDYITDDIVQGGLMINDDINNEFTKLIQLLSDKYRKHI